MPKTPGEMIAAIKSNLPTKTGKTFAEWVRLARSGGPKTAKECRAWLKEQHNLGHGTAGIIALEACQQGGSTVYEDGAALIDAMYTGPKAGLRPIYETLTKAVAKLGKDAELTPCKTYVGLRRKRQFGLIRPTTPRRVELGLALLDMEPQGRLEVARSLGNERITHVVKLASVREIDTEVKAWLAAAYYLAG